jgi:hypothetical protein
MTSRNGVWQLTQKKCDKKFILHDTHVAVVRQAGARSLVKIEVSIIRRCKICGPNSPLRTVLLLLV